jgi:hypothetical protein
MSAEPPGHDDALLQQARRIAVQYAASLAKYGHSIDDKRLKRIEERVLAFLRRYLSDQKKA